MLEGLWELVADALLAQRPRPAALSSTSTEFDRERESERYAAHYEQR